MRSVNRSIFTVLFGALCLLGCSDGSDAPIVNDRIVAEAEAAAIEALERHMVARNNWDSEGLAATNNYPHIRIGTNPPVLTWDAAESFALFNEVITYPSLEAVGWGHSEWDKIEISQSRPYKVHIEAVYSRFDVAGDRFKITETFWIVTKKDGHWGVKFRSSFGEDNDADEAAKAAAESAAMQVLEQHIQARNNRDSEQLAATNNYPHVFLDGGIFQIWDTPENYIVHEETELIPGLDYSDWSRSEWGLIEVIQSGASKVHFVAELSLFNALNVKYETTRSFWVVTKVGEHWGIQGRSSFAKVSD